MAAVSSIIAGVGLAASLGGTAYSVMQGQQQASIQGQQANNNAAIGRLQSRAASITNEGQQRSADLQTRILDLQQSRDRDAFTISKFMAGGQRNLENLKRTGNEFSRAYNADARAAAGQLEGLNLTNDQLNLRVEDIARQGDVLDARAEAVQRQINFLNMRRAQREAVRQGSTAGANIVAQSVNRGIGTNSSVQASRQAGVSGAVNVAQNDAVVDAVNRNTLLDISTGKRLLGVQARETGFESQALARQARGINYGLAEKRFDLAEGQFTLTDMMFAEQGRVTDAMLFGADLNAQYAQTGYALNKDVVQQNQQNQNELLGIQKQIYELGGTNNMLAAQAASAGGLAQIGMGMSSLGNSFVNNASTMGKIWETGSNWMVPSMNNGGWGW